MFRLDKTRGQEPKLPPSWCLDAKVNILPSVSACLAEFVVATLQLHHLKSVLLCCNLLRCQLTKVAAEANQRDSTIRCHKGTALELLTCLAVSEWAGDLHLAMGLSKADKSPGVLDSCHSCMQLTCTLRGFK